MGSAVSPRAAANHINEFVSLGRETQPDSPDSNAGQLRRPAWIKPSNGDIEAGSIMGGVISWPALSESARPVCRSLANPTMPLFDGSPTSSQAPLISQSPQRQANAQSHANSSANNSARQRSRHRGGGSSGSGPSHNTFHRPSPPAPPFFPVYNAPYQPMLDTPRPQGGVGRNTPRRGGNNGPRPRSDGPHHYNYYRRHQDRRDINILPPYMPPPPPPMGYMPSPPLPPGMPPFMGGPPLRIFPGQMSFETSSPFMYVPQPLALPEPAMPIVTRAMPPMTFPSANENSLQKMIIKQIDYYFSDDNLAKDNYLRSRMDDYGWVPITLIANFQRVEQLTKDIQVILDATRFSSVVELQGGKIRRRVAWNKWIQPSSRPNPPITAVASA